MQKAVAFFVSIILVQIGCQETSAGEIYLCGDNAKLVVFDRHSGAHLAHKEAMSLDGEEKMYWAGCGYSKIVSSLLMDLGQRKIRL